jgi:hypothetical protein
VDVIELRIGELVLDGFPPGDRDAIVSALERHLGELLLDLAAPIAALPHAGADVIELPRDAAPAAVGAGIARAVVSHLQGAGA